MNRIILFLLLFLPSLAFAQLYGTGVGYVNGTPTHTPNIAQKGSEICISINNNLLYLWNRDSSEWKPVGGITVTFGAPIAAPAANGGTRTAINLQTGLIYWWNGTAWKEIIAYSVELANIYSAAVAELYANQVRAELADSTATLRSYADSLHIADNDRDSTNERQNLVLIGPVLNITDGNAVDFTSLLSGYLLKTDTTNMLQYYVLSAGWGLLKSGKTLRVDSAKVATKYYADALHAADGDKSATNEIQTLFFNAPTGDLSVSGGNSVNLLGLLSGYVSGSGIVNRIPIWNSSTSFANSPILYNSTTKRTTWDSPGVIELPMGTDAQRPSPATTSDFWYGQTGPEWYNGTRWAKIPEFTFNTGTAGYLPYPNSNGQYTESANLTYISNVFKITNSPDYIEINPSLSGAPNIHLFNSGQAAINLSAINDATVGAALNVTGGIKASGPISTPSVFRAAGLSSQTDPNLAFPVQNGSLVLRTTSGINPFINFFEATIAVKGNIGMTNGNPGDLVFETNPSNTNTFLSGTQRFRVQGSTGRLGIGTGSTINYSLEQLGQTDAFGVARGTVAQRPTIASNTTPIRFSTDSIALEYGESVGTWRQLATRAYARSLVAGLPTTWLKTEMEAGRDVNIKTAKHLYLKTTGSATGTDIYTGGTTYLKTATGDFGGALFFADTTGNLDFAYGWQQDDRTVIQNGGLGRQVTNLLTDYNPTVTFRWVSGVRLDTTTSIHTMRIMWGDKSTNEIYPTEFIFNAASSPNTAATVAAYNFRTAHNIGRLSLNFDNGIYLKKSRKFYLEADSTFAYSFQDNVLQLSQYGIGTKTAADLTKTPSDYTIGSATDGTLIDVPLKFEPYNTITSTSSPQTLSNTKSDNLIDQGSTQASFTLNFPASPIDGQVLKITFNNAISTLTLDGNGNTIIGTAVTTAVQGTQRVFKFYSGKGWIRQN